MSCYWDIRCLDCNDRMGIENANRMGAEINELLNSAGLWELAKAADNLAQECHAELDVNASFYYGSGIDLMWLQKHRGHALASVNEYGEAFGTCGARVTCGSCGHQRGYCGLEKEHEGDHTPLTG